MGAALDEARAALATGDVPIGAIVLAPDGTPAGRGRNVREATTTRPGTPRWSRSARPPGDAASGGSTGTRWW